MFVDVDIINKNKIINQNINNIKNTKKNNANSINYQFENHKLCLAWKYHFLDDFDCISLLEIDNRRIFQLINNKIVIFDINNILHWIFMVHPCMIEKIQINRCFGNVDNINDGLCKITNNKLIHNCKLNRLFMLDPFVNRSVNLLYRIAYPNMPNTMI